MPSDHGEITPTVELSRLALSTCAGVILGIHASGIVLLAFTVVTVALAAWFHWRHTASKPYHPMEKIAALTGLAWFFMLAVLGIRLIVWLLFH